MANVTDGEERYMRQILLLGKGSCLVLRSLVNREKDNDGRSLEDILKSSKAKLQKCLQKFQFDCIYTSATDVNTDIETWDISLLINIILNIFGHLTQEEKDALNEIREIRNEIQGHHSSYSLPEGDYNELRLELNENILKLASDKITKIECDKIMSYSGAGHLTNDIVLKELNALHAFEGGQLSCLNERFGESKSKLDCIGEAVNDVKTVVNTVIENQHEHKEELAKQVHNVHATALSSQEDLAGIKDKLDTFERNDGDRHEEFTEQLQIIRKSTEESKQDIKGMKETASSSSENNEKNTERLRNIEQLLIELRSNPNGQKLQQDVDVNINIKSERSENATEAQGIIIASINDILKEIRNVMEDGDNAEAIMQKVNALLLREEVRDYELTKSLLELIKDIIQHGNIQQARKGSIKLTVRFSFYNELLSFLQYLSSEIFQDRLNAICRALENRTGNVVTLSGYIANESLSDLYKHLEKECKKLRCTKSVVLPMQYKDIMDLQHIWNLLQRGGADIHMKRLSEILTKIVGGKVALTTSVNLEQFEQELLEAGLYYTSSENFCDDAEHHMKVPEIDSSSIADTNQRLSTAGQKALKSSEEINKTEFELDMQQKGVESESGVKQLAKSIDKGVIKLEFEAKSGLKQREDATNKGDDEKDVESKSGVDQIKESADKAVEKMEVEAENGVKMIEASTDKVVEPLVVQSTSREKEKEKCTDKEVDNVEVEAESRAKQFQGYVDKERQKSEVKAESLIKKKERFTDKGVVKLEAVVESGVKQKSTKKGADKLEFEVESGLNKKEESTNKWVAKLEFESRMDEMSAHEPLMRIKKSTTSKMEDTYNIFKKEEVTVIDSAKRKITEETNEGVKMLKSFYQ